MIRIRQSDNITISGYQSAEQPAAFLRVEGEATRDIRLTGNDLSHVREVVQAGDGGKAAVVKLVNNFE